MPRIILADDSGAYDRKRPLSRSMFSQTKNHIQSAPATIGTSYLVGGLIPLAPYLVSARIEHSRLLSS
jgi:VIT1/CCC1 family predicted Fe2+/Mn2+ transporter